MFGIIDRMRLPDTLHELLSLALDDLEKVIKDDRYNVDMGTWHEPIEGKCSVCLAGAVMAKTIKISEIQDTVPKDLEEEIHLKLYAIDSLRMGQFFTAKKQLDESLGKPVRQLKRRDTDGFDLKVTADMECHPHHHISNWREVANRLRNMGV